MASSPPHARYIVNEEGKKSSVVLSLQDYRRLLKAWEEVADAEDFDRAKLSSKNLLSLDELRTHLLGSS